MSEGKKSALERLEVLESDVKKIAEFTEQAHTALTNMSKAIAQLQSLSSATTKKLDSTHSISTELAKGLTGLVGVLEDSGVVDTKAILNKVLKLNEEAKILEEKQALEAGLLVESDQVGDQSLVVVRQTTPSGDTVTLREHVHLSMYDEESKAKLLDKKVGDAVDLDDGSGILHVLAVFNFVEKGGVEVSSAPAEESGEG